MYGAELYQADGQLVAEKVYVKASTTITKGDFITLEYDSTNKHGVVDMAATGERIYGVANETVTQGASVIEKIEILLAGNHSWKVDNDNDTNTFGADAAGAKGMGMVFDITGTTGAQLVDTSTGADGQNTANSAQLICVNDTPDASDTSIGIFKVFEKQY